MTKAEAEAIVKEFSVFLDTYWGLVPPEAPKDGYYTVSVATALAGRHYTQAASVIRYWAKASGKNYKQVRAVWDIVMVADLLHITANE